MGEVSPLFANIALNALDWLLESHGIQFVRCADDFVIFGKTEAEVKAALTLVQEKLTEMSLTLSAEKTKVTTFQEGFCFLGFDITNCSVKMRPKSVENFKAKIKRITIRCHNLDVGVIEQLNRVIRGTENYFAQTWSNCGDRYRSLDRFVRRRLRCMRFKRISRKDNTRMRLKHFENMGLLRLSDLIPNQAAGQRDSPTPPEAAGAISTGSRNTCNEDGKSARR